ncbi:MAG: tetratricopeptide repeat protein [Bacteroidales bacterium]|nr:tetratricopeptide repeat protein [Lentimicrobiaceae bacterium]MDD5693876.1 tetratricopeptide repeat protein [Bacteroidales bacterium]
MAKKKDKAEENILAVEAALSKTEVFIEKNQKILYIIIGAIIVIVLGFFGFKKLYMAPREKEAQSQMFMAEKYFEKDSLRLALNGDGNYLGFLDIIQDYKLTRTAKLAHYYTGLCYLHLGEFQTAIDYLKKFSSKDQIISSMALGATGDAYLELDNRDKALEYYLKAVDNNSNNYTTPMFLLKAGMTYELKGNNASALELYERIRDEFRTSYEFRNIDKYIARVKGLTGTTP